jgi:hypothetical protein
MPKSRIRRIAVAAITIVSALGFTTLAATGASAAPAAATSLLSPHIVRSPNTSVSNSCPAHDWCAYSGYDYTGTEWIWSNYSYNHWYYVGSAENDKWHSWVSGRGWTTMVGYSYPESQSGIAACFTGGSVVAHPGNYPGTSISEAGSISSIDFFNTSSGAECP